MRIDGNAAAVVGDGQKSVGTEFDLDEGRVSGQRLVHGVVDHFGEQMVQRLFVGSTDIHAGAAAHRLEAFEHLDVGGGVGVFGATRTGGGLRGRAAPGIRRPKQIAGGLRFGV